MVRATALSVLFVCCPCKEGTAVQDIAANDLEAAWQGVPSQRSQTMSFEPSKRNQPRANKVADFEASCRMAYDGIGWQHS